MLSDVAPPDAMGADAFWLILALAVGSAIVDWLNKRRQKAEENSEPVPPVRRTTPVSPSPRGDRKLSRWEEELQELLKNLPTEQPSAPPAPPPLPPPVVIPPSRPVPPPARVPPAAPRPVAVRTRLPVPEEAPEARRPSVPLVHSQTAMERAGQLHEEVARQLRRVDELTTRHHAGPAPDRQRAVPTHGSAAVALLRDPRTIRQAIVASLILGPPKALADD